MELVITLLIISVIAAIVIGRHPSSFIKGRKVYITAHRIESDLRHARNLAITNYSSYTFKLYDTDGNPNNYEEYKIFESDENFPVKYVTSHDLPSTVICTVEGPPYATFSYAGIPSASISISLNTDNTTYTVELNDIGGIRIY